MEMTRLVGCGLSEITVPLGVPTVPAIARRVDDTDGFTRFEYEDDDVSRKWIFDSAGLMNLFIFLDGDWRLEYGRER